MPFFKSYPLPICPPGLTVEPGFYDRDSLRDLLGTELGGSPLALSTFYDWLDVCLIAPAEWYEARGSLSDVEILIWYARWRRSKGKADQFKQTLLKWIESNEPENCDRTITVQAR